MERQWLRETERFFDKLNKQVAEQLLKYGRIIESQLDFGDFLMEHEVEVEKEAVEDTKKTPGQQSAHRLAKKDLPKSLKDMMKIWDKWRKQGFIPREKRAQANAVKEQYLKSCRKAWKKASRNVLDGKIPDKDEVVKAIEKESKAPVARVKTIVRTETTGYYNDIRRKVYDASQDVTHYLFLAIRDHATTKWCRSRTGLVYEKGDSILDAEQPPIHWNCRSELLPLTKLNPKHKKLIQDYSKQRRNNACEPLPRDFRK